VPRCQTIQLFDQIPTFSDEELEDCRQRRRPMPVLWQVYRYVTVLAVKIANIDPRSPGCVEQSRLDRARHVALRIGAQC
jgi:hypothetical protein